MAPSSNRRGPGHSPGSPAGASRQNLKKLVDSESEESPRSEAGSRQVANPEPARGHWHRTGAKEGPGPARGPGPGRQPEEASGT
jgi:hypothetical protein